MCALLGKLEVDRVRELVGVGWWEEEAPPHKVRTHGAAAGQLTCSCVVVEVTMGGAWRRAATVRQVDASGRSPASRDTGMSCGAGRGTRWSC